MTIEKEKYPVLYNITFYQLKEGIRYKPLEYIAEDLDLTMLEEV